MKGISDQYLEVLNIPLQKPAYPYLSSICHAYLNTFPYENISKLLFFRDKSIMMIPSFETFLQNHLTFHYGGTCYTLNSNLLKLLKNLGFECYYIMLGNEHMGIIVVIDNERFYVDCGAAAPFFTPVRFENNNENLTKFGNDQIQLLTVNEVNDEYQYVRHTNGKQNGKIWTFNPRRSYELSDFYDAIKKLNQPGAMFMTLLRCQIFQTDKERSVTLVNNKFGIRYANGEMVTNTLSSVQEIEEVIAIEFKLPKLPVKEAVDVLYQLGINIFSDNN